MFNIVFMFGALNNPDYKPHNCGGLEGKNLL